MVTEEFVLSGLVGLQRIFEAKQRDSCQKVMRKIHCRNSLEIGENEESGKWSLDVMFGKHFISKKILRQVIRDLRISVTKMLPNRAILHLV